MKRSNAAVYTHDKDGPAGGARGEHVVASPRTKPDLVTLEDLSTERIQEVRRLTGSPLDDHAQPRDIIQKWLKQSDGSLSMAVASLQPDE